MKTLYTHVNNMINESFFNEIDSNIINESLTSTYLQTVAKQIKDSKNKNSSTKSFGRIFFPLNADWYKITDKDFEEYSAGDKTGIKKARALLSSKTWTHALVLLKSKKNPGKFAAMICYMGKFNFEAQVYSYNSHSYEDGISNSDILQKDVKHDCELYDFLYLDLSKFCVEDIRRDRANQKQGMVLQGNMAYYKQLARDNMDRYRKIVEKKRAERAAKEDTMSEDVNNILNELMQLSTDAFKDPDKYINVSFKICNLISSVYGQRRFGQHGPTGKNGLLVLYKTYFDNHIAIIKNGGYSFQTESQKKVKEELKTEIQSLKTEIENIKSLIL